MQHPDPAMQAASLKAKLRPLARAMQGSAATNDQDAVNRWHDPQQRRLIIKAVIAAVRHAEGS